MQMTSGWLLSSDMYVFHSGNFLKTDLEFHCMIVRAIYVKNNLSCSASNARPILPSATLAII